MGVLAVGLLLTAAAVPMAWLVWPLGYGVALPLALAYGRRREAGSDAAEPDRLDRLKARYVEGDIDEGEFERELETVLAEERA